MLIGFNKTLQIWRYEKSEEQIQKQSQVKTQSHKNSKTTLSGIQMGIKGQERLPMAIQQLH